MPQKSFTIDISSKNNFSLKYNYFYENDNHFDNDSVFLYLHGLPGAPLSELTHIPLFLNNLGFNCITFNYPGMWSKNGTFTLTDLMAGLSGLFKHIKQTFQKITSINLFGESFGGIVAMNILGRSNNQMFEGIHINKTVLKSPVLDINPLIVFLPTTLYYLQHANVINVPNMKDLLADVKKLDPTQYYTKISSQQEFNIWGVIGKNDEVLPASKMVKAVERYQNMKVELWDDFPHNNIEDHLYKKFGEQIKVFMQN